MVAELSEWSQYLSAPMAPQTVEDRRTQCDAAFRDQQDNLIKCYRTFKPKTIACMGSGCLTDIPVDVFLRGGSRVALIDWLPRITELGFQRDLVRREGKICVPGLRSRDLSRTNLPRIFEIPVPPRWGLR